MNRKTLKDDGFAGFRQIEHLEINRIPQRQGLFAMIWQLAGAGALLVAWKELPVEELNRAHADYHARFREYYGRLPYANLVQARA